MGVTVAMQSGGPKLDAYVSRPSSSAGLGQARPGLVLCHGFPPTIEVNRADDDGYSKLADRISGESGWTVLTFNFRGTGRSEGDFSINGWLADLRSAVDYLLEVEQ